MTKKKEKQITIRMPKAKLKLWLDTLRLPANQKLQGTGALYSEPEDEDMWGNVAVKGGYCCLGALQCAITGGKVELGNGLPSTKWLSKEGIKFFDENGILTKDPYFPRYNGPASEVNDSQGKTFKQIAQAIESCAVGY